MRVIAEAVRAGAAVVSVSTDTPRNEVIEDCGRLALQVPETVVGWIWSASAGHVLAVGHGGKPRVYNLSGPRVGPGGSVDFVDQFEVDFAVGDRVALSMAAGTLRSSHVSAEIYIEGSTARFRIVSYTEESYACGANVLDFEGTRASTHAWPALVSFAQVQRAVGRTYNSTWGAFNLFSFGATHYQLLLCELEVHIDGKLFNSTGLKPDQCLLDLTYAPAGAIDLVVRTEISAGRVFAGWEIWDKPIPPDDDDVSSNSGGADKAGKTSDGTTRVPAVCQGCEEALLAPSRA